MAVFTRHRLKSVFEIEKLITIFYMEFSKDFSYGGESHDFWEIVYIDKGEMICTAGKRQFMLKGGEAVFHKPKEFHNLAGTSITAPNVSIITFTCKSEYMSFFNGMTVRLTSEEKKLLSEIVSEGQSVFEIGGNRPPVKNMSKKANSPFGSEQLIKLFLEQLLIAIYRRHYLISQTEKRSQGAAYDSYPAKIREIIDFMNKNIGKNLKIGDIAANFNMSASSLKKLFFFYIKSGIINYFIGLKISEAKKLIREEEYNFTQISEKTGYLNVNYFSKQFKAKTGMTPTEYQKSIKN